LNRTRIAPAAGLAAGLLLAAGCGGGSPRKAHHNFYTGGTSADVNPSGYAGAPNRTSATVLPYHQSVISQEAAFGSYGEITARTSVRMNCWGTNSAGVRLFNVTILDGTGAGTSGNVPGSAVSDQWLSSPEC
jgi:hypothetical protein